MKAPVFCKNLDKTTDEYIILKTQFQFLLFCSPHKSWEPWEADDDDQLSWSVSRSLVGLVGLVGGNPTWHLLPHFLLRFMRWQIFYISISIHLIMITRHIWKTRRRGSLLLSSWSASSCWPAALPSAPPPAASCRTRWRTSQSRSRVITVVCWESCTSRLTLITVIWPVTTHHSHHPKQCWAVTGDQIKPNNSAGAPGFSWANLTRSQELSDPSRTVNRNSHQNWDFLTGVL